VPDVQRQEGRKNIVGNMSERGVTRTTEGLNLKTAAEKCHGGKRTKRSVWTVATQPWAGEKEAGRSAAIQSADYVGLDGKPYTASPDCPVHGPMLHVGMFDKASNGGQPIRLTRRMFDRQSRLVASLKSSPVAKTFRSHSEASEPTAPLQTPESTCDCRSEDHHRECMTHGETPVRNDRKLEPCEPMDGRMDYSPLTCFSTAIDHSNETNRTDHGDQTSQHDTAFVQTDFRTPNKEPSPAPCDLVERRSENSILQAGMGDHPSAEKEPRNDGMSSCSKEYCTCSVVSIAHFATFPPALIRPCILAGCPQGGTVLDPFGGSGTTGAVSEEEGRNSILCELNPAYVKLSEKRTEQQGLFCQTKIPLDIRPLV
jgi:site-specific DNA-methyltransferase (adenine-specific)